MMLSDQGSILIKSFEALRLTPYQDSASLLTVGWGHRTQDPDPISLDQANIYFLADVQIAEDAINNRLHPAPNPPLTQPQFDALTSLVFNIGRAHWWASTLARKLIANDLTASAEFVRWCIVDGNTNAGLLRRRCIERDLFVTGVYPCTCQT